MKTYETYWDRDERYLINKLKIEQMDNIEKNKLISQFGRKWCMCKNQATWFAEPDQSAYCDRHTPWEHEHKIEHEEKKVEIGHESVVIDKMFGPMIFANLRITPISETCTWKIERESIKTAEWIEWVHIPGQLEMEFTDNGMG